MMTHKRASTRLAVLSPLLGLLSALSCFDGGGGGGAGRIWNLPQHFAFGLGNGPSELEWLVESGSGWEYRYQYLSGDVVTGENWIKWQWDQLPPGQFVLDYTRASAEIGVIPIFSYYMIVGSHPNPGSEDPRPKLSNAYTMWWYLSNWKLLMQKCGEFGGTVIVHHEPDFWGFVQSLCGDNPASCWVALSESGFSEAAGYEDNARGLAQVLCALRDAYAPNVILAWHASTWATVTDVIANEGDPVTLGSRVAGFFNALNAEFDLIFSDMSDRDAGWYQYVAGQAWRWWDDADFVRYRQWLATISSLTGRKIMLWQVPCGNTLYRSCNNSPGHYQDNKAQYFLAPGARPHIAEYWDVGVMAVLFGATLSDTTHYTDHCGDGVTNPSPVNGNTIEAQWPDDDGGFLRTAVKQYYTTGVYP